MTPNDQHRLPRALEKMRDSLDRPARENLLALLPKRTVAKVIFLLLLLVGVIYLKQRVGSLLGAVPPTPAGPTFPNHNPKPGTPKAP